MRMLVKKCYKYSDNSLSYLIQIKDGFELVYNEEVKDIRVIDELANLYQLSDFDWIK